MAEQHHVRQFLLFVFALLLPCFALWTVIGHQLAIPAIGLANLALSNWFPDVVNALLVDGKGALLMTEFGEQNGRLVSLAKSEFRLGFNIDTRTLSYSLPFYTALHFATQKKNYLGGYFWGVLILYVLLIAGLVCLCLKELMVNLGERFFLQQDVFVPGADAIGLSYQLSVLIVPTLAPAALWLWQGRESPLLKDILAKIATASQANEKTGPSP